MTDREREGYRNACRLCWIVGYTMGAAVTILVGLIQRYWG